VGAANFVQREIGDDESLAFLVKAANDLTAAANKIQVAVSRAMADEDGSKLGNSRKARKAIAAEVAIASTSVNAASERAHNAIAMLTAKTDPKTAEDFSIAMMHQEVRSALLRMSDAERRKAIATAISSGDETFVAATSGSPMLSGMTATEKTVAREQWRKKRHADVRARIDRLRKGVGQLDRLVPMFNQWAGGLVAEPAPDAAGRRRRARLSVSLGAQPGRSRVSMAVPRAEHGALEATLRASICSPKGASKGAPKVSRSLPLSRAMAGGSRRRDLPAVFSPFSPCGAPVSPKGLTPRALSFNVSRWRCAG